MIRNQRRERAFLIKCSYSLTEFLLVRTINAMHSTGEGAERKDSTYLFRTTYT